MNSTHTKENKIAVDSTPTAGSTNAVQSGAVVNVAAIRKTGASGATTTMEPSTRFYELNGLIICHYVFTIPAAGVAAWTVVGVLPERISETSEHYVEISKLRSPSATGLFCYVAPSGSNILSANAIPAGTYVFDALFSR